MPDPPFTQACDGPAARLLDTADSTANASAASAADLDLVPDSNVRPRA